MSTFSTSSREKRLKTLSFLHFSKCASRHNGVDFFDTFSTSEPPKVVREWCVLYILTWKCASRHNGVHFFNISTSKSGPELRCFVHFDLEMCFAPQWRALFRHRNFQKWSEPLVFLTFWLGNVLRATTACTFSTSQLPKVVRDRQFLTLLTSKCASRHNGVQFFIAPVASWLRTRRFSEPTFRPSGATNHWKNTVFRDFPTFLRICIFFLLTLSLLIFSLLIFLFSLPLPCSAFHLSILSEVWLLNFLRSLHIISHLKHEEVATSAVRQVFGHVQTQRDRHGFVPTASAFVWCRCKLCDALSLCVARGRWPSDFPWLRLGLEWPIRPLGRAKVEVALALEKQASNIWPWQHDSQTLGVGEVHVVSWCWRVLGWWLVLILCKASAAESINILHESQPNLRITINNAMSCQFYARLLSLLPVPWPFGLACTGRCELVGSWKRIPAVEDQLFQSQQRARTTLQTLHQYFQPVARQKYETWTVHRNPQKMTQLEGN